jgi:diamine N-acetyltransferase
LIDDQVVMSITIRTGVPTDARDLAEIASRTFRETFAEDNRPEDLEHHLATAYGPEQQLGELTRPDIVTLLGEVDGRLVAYAQLRMEAAPDCVPDESPVELWRFYVTRDWHGRGVAQQLMKSVEAEAHARGGRTLWLGVWERNQRALAYYRKAGFADVGSHVFMLGTDPQTDRIMVRPLPDFSGLPFGHASAQAPDR